jgi:hypothetical protein
VQRFAGYSEGHSAFVKDISRPAACKQQCTLQLACFTGKLTIDVKLNMTRSRNFMVVKIRIKC